MKRLRLAFGCFSAVVVYTVRAAEFYVATNGNDLADGVSASSPWQTIQRAVTNAAPGDTVYVRGGIYEERVVFTRSGSGAGGHVRLVNYPGEMPVIDGANLTVGAGTDALIAINSHDYIEVNGFEVRNFATAARGAVPVGVHVHGASSHIRLRNLRIHHIETNFDSGGNNVAGADAHGLAVYGDSAAGAIADLLVENVEIHDCRLGSSEAMVLNGNVDGFTVKGCRVHDNNNIGIDFIGYEGTCPNPALDQARNGVCAGNRVYNISTIGNPAYRSGLVAYDRSAGGIYVDGGNHITIDGNTVHDCDIGVEVASEHNGRTTSFITVRNNLIYRCFTGGIFCGGYDATRGNAQYCVFVGNTLYHNDTGRGYNGEIHLQWHVMDCGFENNLVVALRNNGGDAVYVGGPGGLGSAPSNTGFDYNWYYCDDPIPSGPSFRWGITERYTFAWWRGIGNDTAGTYAVDPLLLDPGNDDLHLTTSSPAIDQGGQRDDRGGHDVDGQARVVRGGVDIGADEVQFDTARGTPYWWLEAHGLVTNGYENADNGDDDADGAPAWQEYGADTNPTNAASVFTIAAISGRFPQVIGFASSSNRLYTLLSSSGPADALWTNVPGQGPRAGSGGPDSLTDTNNAPYRFYAIQVERP